MVLTPAFAVAEDGAEYPGWNTGFVRDYLHGLRDDGQRKMRNVLAGKVRRVA